MSRRLRRTKIVVRLNFSHGSAEQHLNRARQVREISRKLGRHVAIMADLQGPKIRISTFREGKIYLKIADHFTLDATLGKDEGDKTRVGIDYQSLPEDLLEGDILLLDDGRVQLKMISVDGQKIVNEVTVGGPLSNNKGINKLGGGLSAEAQTDKDKSDILNAARMGVWIISPSLSPAVVRTCIMHGAGQKLLPK